MHSFSDGGESDVTIIIPQHERPELTIRTVGQLRRWESTHWPIVIVDDGSRPKSVALVENACSDAQIVRQAHCGVTAAWNAGLRAAATPLVVLLNNDVTIDGAWVDALLASLRSGEAAASGVEMRTERAVPQCVLERMGRSEFLAGWCWAFRRDAAFAVGGFDESLRLYFSDTDLQARLLSAVGGERRAAVVRGLPLQHLGHQSARLLSDRRAIWRQDRRRFIQKWSGEPR